MEDVILSHPIISAIVLISVFIFLSFKLPFSSVRSRAGYQYGIILPWIVIFPILIVSALDSSLSPKVIVFSFVGCGVISSVSWLLYRLEKKKPLH